MKFTELKRHIAAKNFFAAYAAAGEDSYLIKKTEEMFLSLVEVADLNLSVIEGDAGEGAVQMALTTLPFMSPCRLVIMDAARQSEIKEYLKNPLPTTVVLLKAGGAYKPIAGVELIDCDRLPAAILALSVAAECKKNGITITDSAAGLLIEYCGRFMGRIRNELYKLMDLRRVEGTNLNGNKSNTITDIDVKAMVIPDLEYKVFELADAISSKNAQKALTLLDDMLLEGYGAAIKVFGLLYSHFRRLLAVSLSGDTSNLASILEVKEFAIKAAARQAAAFSKLKLKRITDMLHKLDSDIKSGRINDRIGLQAFVIEAVNEAG